MSKSVPSWSVPVRWEDVPEAGMRVELAAEAPVRAELARATGLQAMPRLAAQFDVTRHGREGLRVAGTVSATVRQTCVVTLEPVENEIREEVDLTFVPRAAEAAAHGAEAPNAPEPLIDGTVDLGAIVGEFLVLGIDPYPRKPDAVFSPPVSGEEGDHPFAALAPLKKRG
jgi:uncharacterized metal-binding protein YceD (DUF177 family)